MSATIKVERLVNLTVALLEARRPLTFAEIRRRTGYYSQGDAESARRMFERDKDDLRKLGVPIITRDVAFGDDVGYLIDRRTYELPDLDLTRDEVAALSLAVGMAGVEGMRLTWARLAARSPDPVALPAPAVRVLIAADAVESLADPIVYRSTVAFTYRAQTGEPARRTVDPYAVAQRRGAWYLVGHDRDRDALRTFRLDRIEGDVDVVGEAGSFTEPPKFDLAEALQRPEADLVTLTLEVDPASRWAVEARGGERSSSGVDPAQPAGPETFVVHAFDPERDLGWLLGLVPAVRVVKPPEVVGRVVDALTRIRDGHASGESAAGPTGGTR
ncbi:MAG: WYL domain-containing protein [Nitriliruptoraceae bacterium]